ncbi:MAG: carbon starvation protein A [Balneolales bacterium]
MNVIGILLASAFILLIAYRFYGNFIARKFEIDNRNITPAHKQKDGIDYEPAKKPVVLGHHFASIAGAGPIVGPIIAVSFGWVPALLWIIIGGIFFGAVHDLASIMASLRHKGKSIGEIIQIYIGDFGKKLFLIFAFATLLLVIAVFADIVAKTFQAVPAAASSSVMFIGLALLFGFVMKRVRLPFWLISVIGIGLMYMLVFLGEYFPLQLGYGTWILILTGYIFFAAVTPMSTLLQPRDYLSSYLLYGMMVLGILGIFFSNPAIEMDTAIHFNVETLGYLFPVLFVTIACGAISGFHSLVASGTTSKQIDKEDDARVIGFGGMLIETLLAVIAVLAVIVMTRADFVSRLGEIGPVTLFSEGVGGFMSVLGIPLALAVSFVALTVSAFALTSLDTCTRLARFAIQEYFEDQKDSPVYGLLQNRYASTTLVIIFSLALLLTGQFDVLWPIFGSANQLLGALALLAATVWLAKKGINPIFTLIPMVFMFAVTLLSLVLFAWQNFQDQGYVLGVIATLLFMLAIVLIIMAKNSLSEFYGKKEIKLKEEVSSGKF